MTAAMTSGQGLVVVSLGSNLGDRTSHLSGGLEVLHQAVGVVAVSPVYETEPVGGVAQPAYLNLVAILDTADPNRGLQAAHLAETARGRMRPLRWGPRTLDVDVVAAGSRCSTDPRLTLPHPRAVERAFVLRPWLDLDPAAWLPGAGPVAGVLRRIGERGVRQVGPAPGWWR